MYHLFIEIYKIEFCIYKKKHSVTYYKYYDTIVKVVMNLIIFGDAVEISGDERFLFKISVKENPLYFNKIGYNNVVYLNY